MKQKLRRLGIKCMPNLKEALGSVPSAAKKIYIYIYLKITFKKLNRVECRGSWLPKMQRLSDNGGLSPHSTSVLVLLFFCKDTGDEGCIWFEGLGEVRSLSRACSSASLIFQLSPLISDPGFLLIRLIIRTALQSQVQFSETHTRRDTHSHSCY